MKTKAAIIVCIVFLLMSIFCCFPEHKEMTAEIQGVNSSELLLQATDEGNVRREVYEDAEGNITFAIDKHYASVVKQLDENGCVISEFYYDENGMPVAMSSGEYGTMRKYDEQGNEIELTYVDAEGNPIRISSGYVSVLKEYDENGNEIKSVYVDGDLNPVYRIEGYAGRSRKYDENGRCIRITNLGTQGNPINSVAGISVEERTLDEEGRLQTVVYFDRDGEPAANTLGQYGEAYEYDEKGRRYKTTYLDKEGNAALNKDGYAILKKTFKADDSTDTEMYFDVNDQPVKLSHGEYGIRRENGKKYYLTKNGNVNYLLSLDELLHANTLLAFLAGAALCLLAVFLQKSLQVVLLLLYVIFIVYMTLLYRAGGNPEGQFELFWSYRDFFRDSSIRVELFQNIWLFVPLGALLYYSIQKRWVLLIPFLFSIVIETIQYYSGRGLFEFDDMISNGLGGCYGYFMGKLLLELRNRIMSYKNSIDRIKHI